MKQIKLISLGLASLLLFSCSSSNVSSLSPLDESLNKLRSGFQFEGSLVQERTFYKDSSFTKVDQTIRDESETRSESNFFFTFQKDGFSRIVTVYDYNYKDFVPYTSGTYFADESGYLYNEYLTNENTIGKKYVYDEFNKVTLSAAAFDNPFIYINSEDFTKVDDLTYTLSNDKLSFIFYRLCGFYSLGTANPPKENKVTVNKNNEITKIKYSPDTRYVSEYNSSTDSYVYYTIEQTFDFYILNEGKDNLSHIETLPSKELENIELKNAFDAFDGTNVTLNASYKSDNSTKISYRDIYYDSTNVYVKQYTNEGEGNASSLDKENDYCLTINESTSKYEARIYDENLKEWIPSNKTKFGKINQDKYDYSSLIPKISSTSVDLFTYDFATNSYVCDNEAAIDVGKKSFQPIASELRSIYGNYASKISIQLDNDSNIKLVNITYAYTDIFSTTASSTGTITLRFSNYGKTVLPFNTVIK